MTSFTNEQRLPFTFTVTDGRKRPVDVDGVPVATSSDETVATVTIEAGEGKSWNGMVTGVAPGSARVVVDADADVGEGVQDVIGVLEFDVTLDERTGARMITIAPGTPEDKPA